MAGRIWDVALALVLAVGAAFLLKWLGSSVVVLVVVGLIVLLLILGGRALWRRSGKPLKVRAGKPHYHDWNRAASVVALPVKITNKRTQAIDLPGGCSCAGYDGNIPSWASQLTGDESHAFAIEEQSQIRTSHHRPSLKDGVTVPSGRSVTVWHVTAASRGQRGERPRFEVFFRDADENEYSAVFEPGRLPPWWRFIARRRKLAPQMRPMTNDQRHRFLQNADARSTETDIDGHS